MRAREYTHAIVVERTAEAAQADYLAIAARPRKTAADYLAASKTGTVKIRSRGLRGSGNCEECGALPSEPCEPFCTATDEQLTDAGSRSPPTDCTLDCNRSVRSNVQNLDTTPAAAPTSHGVPRRRRAHAAATSRVCACRTGRVTTATGDCPARRLVLSATQRTLRACTRPCSAQAPTMTPPRPSVPVYAGPSGTAPNRARPVVCVAQRAEAALRARTCPADGSTSPSSSGRPICPSSFASASLC